MAIKEGANSQRMFVGSVPGFLPNEKDITQPTMRYITSITVGDGGDGLGLFFDGIV